MFRRLVATVISLLALVSPALAQISGGIFGSRAHAQVVEVAKAGARFTTICGATCTSATADCAAGSAMASITDASSTKPYVIKVAAGVYDECVAVKDKAFISFDLALGVLIKPTTATTGGAFRIAPSGNTTDVTDVTVRGGEIRNPTAVSGAGEAACQIGPEGGTGGAPEWTRVKFIGTRCSSIGRGLWAEGHETASAITAVPRLDLVDFEAIGGVEALHTEGTIVGQWDSPFFGNIPHYCSPGATTGAVRTGAGNGAAAVDIGTTGATTANAYRGRNITLTDGTCAATATREVTVYNGSTKVVTGASNWGFTPDETCNWSIAAPLGSANASCTDSGWYDATGTASTTTSHRAWSTGTSADAPTPGVGTRLVLNNPRFYMSDSVYHGSGSIRAVELTYMPAEVVEFNNAVIEGMMDVNSGLNGGGGTHDFAGLDVATDLGTAQEGIILSGLIRMRNPYETTLDQFGLNLAGNGTAPLGYINIHDLTLDISATVGSFAGTIFDFNAADKTVANVNWSNVRTLQNSGQWRNNYLGANEDTLPAINFASQQKAVASLGGQTPNWSATSAAWTAGDLFCSRTNVPNGMATPLRASISVGTLSAGKLCSVCAYDITGDFQLATFESIDCGTANERNVAKTGTEVNPIYPGDIWICIGSDATATLTLKGLPAATRGASVVGRLGTGAATCPASIAPGSMTAVTTAVPEAVLLP